MPKVSIKQQTQSSAPDAFNKVKGFLSNDADLKKLDAHYQCTFNDSALSGVASGKMFKAHMTVKGQGAGSEVEIVVDLPLALALLKGQVQKIIEKKLRESLG